MICKLQQDRIQQYGHPKRVPKKYKADFVRLNCFLLKRSFIKLFMFPLLINPSTANVDFLF